MTYARIIGTGSYLPEYVLTNAELEKRVETSDEWIVSPTTAVIRAAPRIVLGKAPRTLSSWAYQSSPLR